MISLAPAPSLAALAEVASPETIRAVLELMNTKAYVEAAEREQERAASQHEKEVARG